MNFNKWLVGMVTGLFFITSLILALVAGLLSPADQLLGAVTPSYRIPSVLFMVTIRAFGTVPPGAYVGDLPAIQFLAHARVVPARRVDNSVKLIEYFIARGADVNAYSRNLGLTALHDVILNKDIFLLEILLVRGANIHRRSIGPLFKGLTPLELALEMQKSKPDPVFKEIIQALKDHAQRPVYD